MKIVKLMDSWFESQNFIQEQFLFEKSIVDKIVECQDDQICIQKYKQIRKDFKNGLLNYFNELQQQIYQDMKQKCLNLEEPFECLRQIDKSELAQQQMLKFKEQRKNITKQILK
ncbi:hypothetical protein pb186bvf_007658 [Paramecium bursaria]